MSYYRGDYYRGDFWSGLGKGIKRIGRDIGRAAKAVAPIAGIILPAVGAATLVGRGVAAAGKIKKLGRTARGLASAVAPNPNQTPISIVSQLTGQTVGMPVLTSSPRSSAPLPVSMDDAPASPRRPRRRRRPQRRLRRITRRTTRTTRRRRRRPTARR